MTVAGHIYFREYGIDSKPRGILREYAAENPSSNRPIHLTEIFL
jgi:hypothetical protein